MRTAILSDIHSNLEALTKALSIIDDNGIDELICLGDIVGYGGNPNECVAIIHERNAKCVLGNHDLAALDPSQAYYFTLPGRKAAEWTNSVLDIENMQFLSAIPYLLKTDSCTFVHASPLDPPEWHYVFSIQDARLQFQHFSTQLCFIGHTHVPFVCAEDLKTFRFCREKRFVINVGSVGQPRDSNPHLSFGILDTDTWTYENIRAPYDIRGASRAILRHGLPSVLSRRLFQGL